MATQPTAQPATQTPAGTIRGKGPSARLVSLEEYLRGCYDPDCEFDDGRIVERNLDEFEHSFLQTILAAIFTNNMQAWGVYGLTEQRMKLKDRQYRVPDVCVLRVGTPREKILTRPPLIAIEIQSPEDTLRGVAKKAAEYAEFGIEHVWVIDPEERKGYLGSAQGLELVAGGVFSVAGTAIQVSLDELFDRLDRI